LNTEEEALDFRQGGHLAAHMLRRLDEIAAREYAAFNGLVARLSRGRERNIDWWVCRPATRNNHSSALYTQCMQLALVRQLLDEGRRLVVTVDSPEMARVLRRGSGRQVKVVLAGRGRTRLRRFHRMIRDIVSSIFHCGSAAVASRLTRRSATPPPAEPINLLGTFFMNESLANGKFRDLDYPGLMEMLSERECAHLYYLPIFYRQRHYLSTFGALRTGPANFLFREDYLGLRDYAFAFGHWRRAAALLGAIAQFADFEIGPIIDADLRAGRFAWSVVASLLLYRFIVALPRHGVRVRHFVDFYEGLDLNHAIAAAVNWHDAEIKLVGFRSVGSLFYMSATPVPHELEAGVVPHTMAVVGARNADAIQAICPTLCVVTGPGFRYRRTSTMQREIAGAGKSVLLALPMWLDLACQVITTVDAARRLITHGPTQWQVKCHPGLPATEVLAALEGGLPQDFLLVDGDFYRWLARADVVISVASSTLVEAVALGIPTVCIASGNAPTEIPVPAWVDLRLQRVVYSAAEAAAAITASFSEPPTDIDCIALRQALLSPADECSVRRMLGLDEVPRAAPYPDSKALATP